MPGKRNADDKKSKLIEAVGETLKENGYRGLGLNKVAARAGVSKPMVYEYFGSLNGLLKAYIAGKDSWVPYLELWRFSWPRGATEDGITGSPPLP